MHPQLEEVVDQFSEAQRHLHALAANVPDALWSKRPAPDRWSVADNIEHLNLTAEQFIPVIRAGLAEARHLGAQDGRYRRDFIGWVLWKSMPPPVKRLRIKTPPKFMPQGRAASRTELLARFDQLQQEQIDLVRAADGLAIDKAMIVSPVDAKGKYSIYSAFTILPPHQERHIWQAEQVLKQLA